MKNITQKIMFTLATVLLSISVWSQPQTITLELPTMNCAMCPLTVKKSLKQVDGVSEVAVNYETKLATITFDDDKTQTSHLIKATTDAGYPSNLKAL